MLKPITSNEKLDFTLRLQANKATDEILGHLFYEEKYSGLVDIWPIISIDSKSKKVVLEMLHKKVQVSSSALSHPEASRFVIVPEKGIKLVK